MNILFLDQYGEMGGAQRCLLELIPAVLQRGWKPYALVPSQGDLATRLTACGVEVRHSPNSFRGPGYLPACFHLAQQIKRWREETNFQLFYVNGPRVLPAACMAGRTTPIVLHAHSFLPPGLSRTILRGCLHARNTTVIAVSNFVARYLRAALPPARLHVIPNGVPPMPQSRPSTGTPRIGIIGRIAPEKGHLEFVEAVRLLPRDWRFLICGTSLIANPAYEQRVRNRAATLPIQFLGWKEDIGDVLKDLDLLVVPSAPNEGLGRVVLEAFSARVPVVAFPSGGIPELIENNRTGFLVDERTPQALASRIRELMQNPNLLDQTAHQARLLYESNNTLSHYQDRVTNVIARLQQL